MSRFSAFTLVELLIAISILGILSGVIITVINPSKERAKASDAVLKNAISDIASSIEIYKNTQGTYPATPSDLLPYLTGGFVADSNGFKSNDISVGGVNGGTINWMFLKTCLDAKSNVDLTKFFQWRPGTGVLTVSAGADCASL